MAALSWDLHLHPGPSAVPRWGDGLRIWEAARDAGVRGFVWKSHEEHTVTRCHALPAGPPFAIPSVSLNPWATCESVIEAIEQGARWIWGPSRDAAGSPGWELPLPSWWSRLREYLAATTRQVALATSHLDQHGRLGFAEIAASNRALGCTVTHSLYLSDSDADELAGLGCTFEFDLYTATFPEPGRPAQDLAARCAAFMERGYPLYLTSDAGQAQVGNPFEFSARALLDLSSARGPAFVQAIAVDGPARFVRRILPAEVAA
ncbi:MAG TPA: DUF6282 family protein [Candidatus Limnocylindrales bacterium]|nr:DUF6282 family protein [Candidatus Limnocylindrales bacterium]